jgi:hypothetical protein
MHAPSKTQILLKHAHTAHKYCASAGRRRHIRFRFATVELRPVCSGGGGGGEPQVMNMHILCLFRFFACVAFLRPQLGSSYVIARHYISVQLGSVLFCSVLFCSVLLSSSLLPVA